MVVGQPPATLGTNLHKVGGRIGASSGYRYKHGDGPGRGRPGSLELSDVLRAMREDIGISGVIQIRLTWPE